MDMGSLPGPGPGPGPAAQPAPCYARRGCAHWRKENRIDREIRDNTQEGGQVEMGAGRPAQEAGGWGMRGGHGF